MKKKSILIAIVCLFVLIGLASCCKGEKPTDAADVGSSSEEAQAGLQTAQKDSPFDQVVSIFKGFEDIVEKNRGNPVDGAKACNQYAEANIPKIKAIEESIGKFEKSPEYIDRMMNANKEIKEISDQIAKIVTESYGVDGADVLMKLSDMALARF